MVKERMKERMCHTTLSVLALSSRFDGRGVKSECAKNAFFFQYSLCRVVLMVNPAMGNSSLSSIFQYSLCRVVLMVEDGSLLARIVVNFQYSLCRVVLMVATGSVVDTTATLFQYSLCRVVLMVV